MMHRCYLSTEAYIQYVTIVYMTLTLTVLQPDELVTFGGPDTVSPNNC